MKTTIVYDTELWRPACILLQVAFGASVDSFALSQFEADWLVAPTPGMKKYDVTPEQLKVLQGLRATDGSEPAWRARR